MKIASIVGARLQFIKYKVEKRKGQKFERL